MKKIIKTIILLFVFANISAQNDSVFARKFAEQQLTDSTVQQRFDFHYYAAERHKMHSEYRDALREYKKCLEIDSTNAAAWFELSKMEQFTNHFTDSYESLLKAVKYDAKNTYYQEVLATYYVQTKNINQAISIFENLSKKNKGKVSYLYALLNLYSSKKQDNKMLELINKIDVLTGISEAVTMAKVEIFYKKKKHKKAITEIKKLIAKYPAETRYETVLGEYYLTMGDTIRGLQTFENVLKKRKNDGYALIKLFDYYQKKGDINRANDCLKRALQDKNVDIEEKMELITPYVGKLLEEKNTKQADALFEELLKNYENESEVYALFAAYLLDLENYTKAEENLVTAISLYPENERNWIDLAAVYAQNDSTEKLLKHADEAEKLFDTNTLWAYYKVVCSLHLKKNNDAIELINNYLEKFSDEEKIFKSMLLSFKADEMMQQKKHEKAFETYEKALQFDANNIGVLNNYAYYLSECGLELRKAETMSGKTIQAEPQNATYLDTYAWILFKQNDYRAAKFYIERALLYDKKNETLLDHYGDILFALGDIENAVAQWIKSQAAGNESEILQKKITEKEYYPSKNECE